MKRKNNLLSEGQWLSQEVGTVLTHRLILLRQIPPRLLLEHSSLARVLHMQPPVCLFNAVSPYVFYPNHSFCLHDLFFPIFLPGFPQPLFLLLGRPFCPCPKCLTVEILSSFLGPIQTSPPLPTPALSLTWHAPRHPSEPAQASPSWPPPHCKRDAVSFPLSLPSLSVQFRAACMH